MDMADPFIQNLFVMRHGETLDDDDGPWLAETARPWDPPITERGRLQAWELGRKLRVEGWKVTRLVVSPFLSCVQTAAEVATALCSTSDGRGSRGGPIDPSRVKMSIEYGLTEMMNARAISHPPVTCQVPWTLQLPELYALLPRGTTDTSVRHIRRKLPSWTESTSDAHKRYSETFQAVANEFSEENVLFITHGEAVRVSVLSRLGAVKLYGVTFCSFTHAQRPVYNHCNGDGWLAGDWELLTESGPTSGLFFSTC